MRIVFAIEAFVLISATLAMIVALIARLPWRWLRFTLWFVLAWASLGVWAQVPFGLQRGIGTQIEKLNGEYPTLMCIAWTSLATLTVGVTLLPLIGFWRRGEKRIANGRFWPLGRLSLAIVLTLLAVIVTIFVRDRYVEDEIARARLVNKVRIAMLAPRPVDPDEDAAPVYFRVYAEMAADEKELGASDADWFKDVQGPTFDLQRPEMLAFRKRHSDRVATLVAAAKAPSATLHDQNLGILDELPRDRFDSLWALLHLVALEARCRAHEGDFAGCWECLSCLAGIQRHASAQRDTTWAHLARTIDHSRAAIVEVILACSDCDFGKFAFPLENDSFTCRSAAMDAAQLDACEVLELTCANARCELDKDARIFDPQAQLALRATWPVRQLYALYSRVFVLADGLATFDGLYEHCQELGKPEHLPSKDDREWLSHLADLPPSELADYCFNSASTGHTASIDSDARRRLADLAIAVAGFRCRKGHYPNAMEELVPEFLAELPLDPWNGEAFRFAEADGGMLVYSVGRNQIDEKGFGDITDYRSPDITLRIGGAYRKWRSDMDDWEKKRKAKAGG